MPLSKSQADNLYASKGSVVVTTPLNASQLAALENEGRWNSGGLHSLNFGFGVATQKAVSTLDQRVYECISDGVWVRFSYASRPYFFLSNNFYASLIDALTTETNWVDGSFMGNSSSSLAGMQHYDANYKYECVVDGGTWIRTPRQ